MKQEQEAFESHQVGIMSDMLQLGIQLQVIFKAVWTALLKGRQKISTAKESSSGEQPQGRSLHSLDT